MNIITYSNTLKMVFLSLIIFNSAQAEPKVATVSMLGVEGGCDFGFPTDPNSTGIIQQVIDSPENYDEIRITGGSYEDNLTLNGRSITIKGSYINCEDAANDIQLFGLETEIHGRRIPNRATIHLTGEFDGPVVLDQVFFESSSFDTDHNGGGIFIDHATVDVEVIKGRIIGNKAQKGGGIAVIGGAVNLTILNTFNSLNEANEGGGIYCSGQDSKVNLLMFDTPVNASPNFSLSNNKALAGDGGGVLVENGCQFVTNVGSYMSINQRGLLSNKATGNGGAVAVRSGASAKIIGYADDTSGLPRLNLPALIKFNRADSDNDGQGDGGAIYVEGDGSQALIAHSLIQQNHAAHGGAIAVSDGGELIINRNPEEMCWDTVDCNLIIGNDATVSGGAIHVEQAGIAQISQTRFTENRSNVAAVVSIEDEQSSATLNTVLMDNNGANGDKDFSDEHLVTVKDEAVLQVLSSTITDNPVVTTIFENTDAELNLQNTIVYDSQTPVDLYTADANATLTVDCSLLENSTGVNQSLGADVLIGFDPVFADAENMDYHLTETSPAIDFCSEPANAQPDIDQQIRPHDIASIADDMGSYDIGFDEYYDDLIFRSGFE